MGWVTAPSPDFCPTDEGDTPSQTVPPRHIWPSIIALGVSVPFHLWVEQCLPYSCVCVCYVDIAYTVVLLTSLVFSISVWTSVVVNTWIKPKKIRLVKLPKLVNIWFELNLYREFKTNADLLCTFSYTCTVAVVSRNLSPYSVFLYARLDSSN